MLLLLAALLLPFGALAVKVASATAPGSCTIYSVVDGDTVKAWCPRRGMESVRLLGYDTPEVSSPRCQSERWRGLLATGVLAWHLVAAERVQVLLQGRDRYDRSLGRLLLDGRDIASTMVTSGHGRPYSGGRRAGWCG